MNPKMDDVDWFTSDVEQVFKFPKLEKIRPIRGKDEEAVLYRNQEKIYVLLQKIYSELKNL